MADGTIDLGAVRDAREARTVSDVPTPPGRLDTLNEAVTAITLIAAAQAQMGRMVIRLQEEVTEQKTQIAGLIESNRALVQLIRPAQIEGNPDDDNE